MTGDLAIHCWSSAAEAAARVAARLGLGAHPIGVHRFPDGEMRVTVAAPARTSVLYVPLDQPNEKLIAILLAAEALRRNGAERLVLVAPYLCYMRQDAAFHAGEAISQKAIGRLLAASFDRVVTVDAHLHRTAALDAVFPGIAADNVPAAPAIARFLRAGKLDPATVVVGPDEESLPWVRDLATLLGAPYAVGRKLRKGDHAVVIDFSAVDALAGRPVLLLDDIASSGGTLIACAAALHAAGAASVDAIVTHALFPAEMVAVFARSGLRSIRSTDSVPHPTNAIPLDELLAAALRAEDGGAAAGSQDRCVNRSTQA